MIRLQDISRHFVIGDNTVHALDRVSLHITAGEYVAVMGPSGSGKSTLLNVIGLLDRPDDGRYLLDGEDTTTMDEVRLAGFRRRHIGFVFQSFHLVPRLSAAANVELPMVLAGIPAEQRRRRTTAALEAVGLTDRAGHRPEQLSGGQRQRVAVARATIMGPAVLLADEPTGNLDTASGMEVMALLETLNGDGLTLILVTHDASLGGRARRMVRLLDGRVESDERLSTGPESTP